MTSIFSYSLSRFIALVLAAALFCLSKPASAEIKVGVSDWPGWVAWYVAEKNGYFKKYGAKVKLAVLCSNRINPYLSMDCDRFGGQQ